jgi:RNA polymerase sigma factor (sigma-70 family)
MTDSELIQQYVRTGSEAAFRELVHLHISLVYAAASRQLCGDEHRAKDVTQEVFVRLARKASSLTKHPSLAGWLYATTRFIAVDIVRSESSRRHREQEAHAMQEPIAENQGSVSWDTIRPVIDDAMSELSERDRQSVLARFFTQQSYAEIGTQLGVSENAAQKGVSRALDKLREALSRRGVTSTATGLALILANQPVAAVPAGLAASASAAALAGTSGGVAIFMAIGKLQLSVVAALAIAGIATITVQHRAGVRLDEAISTMQRENQQIALLRAENKATQAQLEGLRAEHAENVRLRGEMNALKSTPTTKAVPAASSPPPGPMRSVDSLHNVGNATPSATLESLIWAKENVEIATLSRLFTFTPDVRKKVEDLFVDLSENERAKQGITTPEQLVAFYFGAMTAQIADLQLTEQYQIDPDNVAIRTVLRLRQGEIANQQFNFRRSPEGWQWVFPSDLAGIPDALRKQIASKPDSKRFAHGSSPVPRFGLQDDHERNRLHRSPSSGHLVLRAHVGGHLGQRLHSLFPTARLGCCFPDQEHNSGHARGIRFGGDFEQL